MVTHSGHVTAEETTIDVDAEMIAMTALAVDTTTAPAVVIRSGPVPWSAPSRTT